MHLLRICALLCCVGVSSVLGCRTAGPGGGESARAPHHVTQYIALGDSISTDDYPGRDRGAVSLFYRNHDEDFPAFEGRDLLSHNAEMQLVVAASNGATTEIVLYEQLPQLQPNGLQDTLVTLTIGGNDLLRAIHSDPHHLHENTDVIVHNIQQILAMIQEIVPGALILLGTIYDPTDGVGDLFVPGQRLLHALDMLDRINESIRSFAEHPQIHLVDIHQHFLGHGSHHADSSNPHYDWDDPTYWFMSTIEPNERGASEVRRLFWSAFEMGLQALKKQREQ